MVVVVVVQGDGDGDDWLGVVLGEITRDRDLEERAGKKRRYGWRWRGVE